MTDRVAGFIVTLKEDWREDDPNLPNIVMALRMLGPVLSVKPLLANHALVLAQERRDHQWQEKINDAFTDLIKPPAG